MAFEVDKLAVIAGPVALGDTALVTVWAYDNGTDNVATMQGAGYFEEASVGAGLNEKYRLLREGDIIYVPTRSVALRLTDDVAGTAGEKVTFA